MKAFCITIATRVCRTQTRQGFKCRCHDKTKYFDACMNLAHKSASMNVEERLSLAIPQSNWHIHFGTRIVSQTEGMQMENANRKRDANEKCASARLKTKCRMNTKKFPRQQRLQRRVLRQLQHE